MERVKKGDWYWFIFRTKGGGFVVNCKIEEGGSDDNARFDIGNYFIVKEEAETMASKLRAVLKGAEVIEMPSEVEIREAMKTSVTESILCVAPYETFTPRATDLLECAWMKGAEWVKSKIIK